MRILIRLVLAFAIVMAAFVAADHLLPDPAARVLLDLQRRVAGLAAHRTQIPGFDIAYLEGGSGEPLVLVHGIGADKDNFDRVAMFLTRHYHVFAIDLPGFGESSKPAHADYRIDAQVARLDQILDAVQLDRTHLGGSSMGGWLVASYAAAHPARVQSLWLLDPAGVGGGRESEVRRAYHESGKYLLFAQTPGEYEQIIDTVFVHRPFVPYSVRRVLARRAIGNYDLHTSIFRALLSSNLQAPLEPQVKDLATPTLIVFGERDRAVDPSAGAVLHDLMPNSQLVLIPDVGHLPMLEVPRRAAEDYLAFRSRLKATGS